MAEGDAGRLVAWGREMRRAHARLRKALEVTTAAAAEGGRVDAVGRDLVLYCRGFCAALGEHHLGEDRMLFPALAEAHPELEPALRRLSEDHAMIASLLEQLQAAVDGGAAPEGVDGHLEGVAAIMESHFAYEERELLGVLHRLRLEVPPSSVFGSL